MLDPMRRTALTWALVAFCAGCGDISLDPLPFEVAIEASSATVAVGESVNFLVITQGGRLLGVDTDYGDGRTDQYGMGGARTARVSFSHAFEAAGAYDVRATVTDAVAGQKDASVTITVQ
jgi:hypothetical protein